MKNLMMDASSLYPRGYHPVADNWLPDVSGDAPRLSRAQAPVKYYYVDYDISVHIAPDVFPKLAEGTHGRDQYRSNGSPK